MPPASEMAIRSSTVTGIHRERDRRLARIDGLLERPGAAGAADEVDALVGADVADVAASARARCAAGSATSRLLARESSSGVRRRQVERVPAGRRGTSTPRPCRRGVAVPSATGNCSRSAARNCRGVAPGEILHGPVVRQDLHLVVGERHGDERARAGRTASTRRAAARRARARRSRRDDGRRRCRAPESRRTRRRAAVVCSGRRRQIVCCTPSAAVKSYSGAPAVTALLPRRSTAGAAAIGQEHDAGLRAQLDRCAACDRLPCRAACARAS